MSGLLMKDLLLIIKQLKLYLLLIVVLTFIPGFSMLVFAIVYSTMLPMTAIAFDERSKWDELAAMMPYSVKDIVLSKYALGLLLVFGTAAFSCFAQAIVGIFTHTMLTGEFFTKLVLAACVAFVVESIELPVLIRFGTEKGRLLVIALLVFLGVGSATLVNNLSSAFLAGMTLELVLPLALLGASAITVLSAFLAVRLYAGKKA